MHLHLLLDVSSTSRATHHIWFYTFEDKEPLSIFSNPRASTHSARPEKEIRSGFYTSSYIIGNDLCCRRRLHCGNLNYWKSLRGLSLSRRPAWLTSQNHLPCHEESSGACGAVVVDIDDGDPGQAQAVVNGPLSTCGVPWRNQVEERMLFLLLCLFTKVITTWETLYQDQKHFTS